MTTTKPNLASVLTLATLNLDFGLDPLGVGGIAEEGIYTVQITELGLSSKDARITLNLTLTGIGPRETYDYVTLPTDPNHEHFKTYSRALLALLHAVNPALAQHKAQAAITGEWLNATLLGKTAQVYFIPPMTGADGRIIDGSKQEVTYLTPELVADIQAGKTKPTRRMKGIMAPNSLGAPVGGAVPTAPTAPAFTAPTPVAPAMTAAPQAPAFVTPQPVAPAAAAPVALPGAPSLPGLPGLPPGMAQA